MPTSHAIDRIQCANHVQSYDNWHFFGYERTAPRHERPLSRGRSDITSSTSHSPSSTRPAYHRSHRSSGSEASASTVHTHHTQTTAKTLAPDGRAVVCRVSQHTLRLEREFHLSKLVVKESDPECRHFVRPIEFVRLPAKPGEDQLVASIFEAPGPNFLKDLMNFGPNWYNFRGNGSSNVAGSDALPSNQGVPLLTFLDFAVGSVQCLEILHHGHEIVHGEIRGDAFHFAESGVVKMIVSIYLFLFFRKYALE